jgi:hemoglobin
VTKKTLDSRADLEILLDRFYGRVREDQKIGPIFNEVAKVDWDQHVKKIYNFWDDLLFGAHSYHGRPFPPHVPLGLKVEHFERWLELFFQTTDELFEGQKADEIKMRALNIGRHFLAKLQHIEKMDT